MNKKVVVGGLVIGGGLLYLLGRKHQKNAPDETEKDAQNDVIINNLTYQQSWYSQTADALEIALKNSWDFNPFTSDYEHKQLKSVLYYIQKLKNRNDWLQLVAKFGTRKRLKLSFAKGTLNEWILSLTDVNIQGSNKSTYLFIIRKLLRKRGVTSL